MKHILTLSVIMVAAIGATSCAGVGGHIRVKLASTPSGYCTGSAGPCTAYAVDPGSGGASASIAASVPVSAGGVADLSVSPGRYHVYVTDAQEGPPVRDGGFEIVCADHPNWWVDYGVSVGIGSTLTVSTADDGSWACPGM